MDELAARAYRAWFIACKRAGNDYPDQPNARQSGEEVVDGRKYFVLRGGWGGGNRILAVYRVRNDGMLKGLRRWPAALEARP